MAKIPRVNEKNEVVGETTIREAKENGWPRRVARLFIFDESGEYVLLQKRSESVDTEPGRWDTSGGHVDLGETYAEAAKREVGEELGITVKPFEISKPVFLNDTFYVACRANADRSAKLTLKEDEVETVSWIPVKELTARVQQDPQAYTTWLAHSWEKFHDKLIGKSN